MNNFININFYRNKTILNKKICRVLTDFSVFT